MTRRIIEAAHIKMHIESLKENYKLHEKHLLTRT
jgi:hypothetical protein